ncbi:hypothetical protein DSUL_40074 [Desulfovibrionales bacterium]
MAGATDNAMALKPTTNQNTTTTMATFSTLQNRSELRFRIVLAVNLRTVK